MELVQERFFLQSFCRNWMDVQVKGTSLPRALHCWDRSLQNKLHINSSHSHQKHKTPPVRGCPMHLIDSCSWPHCNPSCPTIRDQLTGRWVWCSSWSTWASMWRWGLSSRGPGSYWACSVTEAEQHFKTNTNRSAVYVLGSWFVWETGLQRKTGGSKVFLHKETVTNRIIQTNVSHEVLSQTQPNQNVWAV